MDPFFSIIIPTYNRAGLIGETLKEILKSPVHEIEVIVVDDGSVDKTFEVVNSIEDNRLFYFKISNGERGKARNIGASLAKGMYINFFDSDDIFLACFSQLQEFIQSENKPDLVFGSVKHVGANSEKAQIQVLPYSSFTKKLLHNNFLACGAVFLKREIALEFPFNEDRHLSSAEDWELWLRIHTRYDFVEFSENIFEQVQHQSRSLKTINAEKVEKRDCYFASLVIRQEAMHRKFGTEALQLFVADRFSFIALTYCEEKQFIKAFFYWRKAVKSSLKVLKRRRFWAVLKKLVWR